MGIKEFENEFQNDQTEIKYKEETLESADYEHKPITANETISYEKTDSDDTETLSLPSSTEDKNEAIHEAIGSIVADEQIENGVNDEAFVINITDDNIEESSPSNSETVFMSDLDSDAPQSDEINITDSNIPIDSEKENTEASSDENNNTDGEEDLALEKGIADNSEEKKAEEKKSKKSIGYNPDKPRGIDVLFDVIELFIFSLAAVLLLTTFVFRHSVVDGSSMENTLFDGEHIIISDLFYTPERGDIIVCEDYTTQLRKPIVKRVIGIAGDRVQVTEDGRVTVNGELLEEDYVFVDFGATVSKPAVDVVVPEGEVFVMGDHRNMSTDSRDIGTVKVDSILGKVLFRFYPFDKFGEVS